MLGRISADAVAASIAPALRAVHAEPSSSWARQLTAQLIAVVEYAQNRPPDRTHARRAELAVALTGLAGNPLVPAEGSVEQRAGAALAAAVESEGTAHATAVRAALRPLLVAELDEELAETAVMMDGLRGRVGHA
jgi:hypothetical protein